MYKLSFRYIDVNFFKFSSKCSHFEIRAKVFFSFEMHQSKMALNFGLILWETIHKTKQDANFLNLVHEISLYLNF